MGSTLLNQIEGRNLTAIVEYLLGDEQQDFLDRDDEAARDHIFLHIAPVADALFFTLDDKAVEKYNRLVSPLNRIDGDEEADAVKAGEVAVIA